MAEYFANIWKGDARKVGMSWFIHLFSKEYLLQRGSMFFFGSFLFTALFQFTGQLAKLENLILRASKALATQRKDVAHQKENKSPVNLKSSRRSCQSALFSILYVKNYNAALKKELSDRLNFMLDETTTNPVEKKNLHDYIIPYANAIKYLSVECVTLNDCCFTLEEIWPSSKGVSSHQGSEVTSASKNASDIKGLSESHPYKSVATNFGQVLEELVNEYLAFMTERIRSFQSSEILRFLATKAGEQANHPSRSTEEQLTYLMEKVYGDAENTHIFAFRPIINKLSKSKYGMDKYKCPDFKKVSREVRLRDYQMSGQEIIAVYCSAPCTNLNDEQHKDCKVYNAAHIVFKDIERIEGIRKKKSALQMSKQKIAKYRRVGLSVIAEE